VCMCLSTVFRAFFGEICYRAVVQESGSLDYSLVSGWSSRVFQMH
jgi:hypothetical protein